MPIHIFLHEIIQSAENTVKKNHGKDMQEERTASQVGCRGDLGERERDLLACLPAANIEEATSVCTGGSNMPLAYCDFIFQIHSQAKKDPHPLGVDLFWRSERDLNPRALFRRLLP